MIQAIAISRLSPYPESSNQMSAECFKKLTRHIKSIGRYEPLIVRPHPRERGRFQVINGHHRLRVLQAIGHERAQCFVWGIDDDQARLYLATLNRLSGTDVPERRSMLIAGLLKSFDPTDLSELLPDERKQIEAIKALADAEITDLETLCPTGAAKPCAIIVLDFMLTARDAKIINRALDSIIENGRRTLTRSQAPAKIARLHLNKVASTERKLSSGSVIATFPRNA